MENEPPEQELLAQRRGHHGQQNEHPRAAEYAQPLIRRVHDLPQVRKLFHPSQISPRNAGDSQTGLLGQTISLVDQSDGVPAAVACNDKGGELKAAQKLLGSDTVNLVNATVSADALHCQQQTAHTIVTKGGDYILRVKANQPGLLKAAKKKTEGAPPLFQKTKKATGE